MLTAKQQAALYYARKRRREAAIAAEGSEWSPTIGEWTAGENTTLSIAGGRARATAIGVNNPRIYRHVTGFTVGNTYRIQTTMYAGTAVGPMFSRATETNALGSSGPLNQQATADPFAVDTTFVATATGLYVGLVTVCDADAQYSETDENFVLTEVA